MKKTYTSNLPQLAYSAQQVKQHEGAAASDCGLTLTQLMTLAGQSVADLVMNEISECTSVLVVAGKGNNAGDGFIAASRLLKAGKQVWVFTLEDPRLLSGDAGAAYRGYLAAGGLLVDTLPQSRFDVVIDAVLGTGFKGDLPSRYKEVFSVLNQASGIRVSIDVPSGVDASSAAVAQEAFRAHHTITFIALKQGLVTGRARECCGTLWFAGLEVAQAFENNVKASARYPDSGALMALRPTRSLAGYKNNYGHVLVVAGGPGMAGAARLAAEACLRSGAGLVSVATHPDNVNAVLSGRFELMVHGAASAKQLHPLLDKAGVVVLGPGLGQCAWAENLWLEVLAHYQTKPLVLDADALNLLAKFPRPLNNAVLTPHSGEAGRLLGLSSLAIEADRFYASKKLVEKYCATCVLKGPGSLVSNGNDLSINRSGCGAMASAGMGDILSGMIAALLAQGLKPFDAACLGVYIHGQAAEQAARDGAVGLIASDLFPCIRRLMG